MTVNEQAKLYAQACRAWYGERARDVVLGKLAERRRIGDQSGARVWELTANELAHQEGRQDVHLS
jgi:hypothetical protein